ncbi:MAG: hypothetical protein AMJ65_01625 [Phycisphaerae bacterium SG8_4]|nr:MAG: hypothetical protein AMJ65_01625 [Phycisphaerae bacterium SG8_4]
MAGNKHDGFTLNSDINLGSKDILAGTGTTLGVPQVIETAAYTAGATGTILSLTVPANELADKGDCVQFRGTIYCTTGSGESIALRLAGTTLLTEADGDTGESFDFDVRMTVTTANATANYASAKLIGPAAVSSGTPTVALGADCTAAVTFSIVTGGGTYTIGCAQAIRIA